MIHLLSLILCILLSFPSACLSQQPKQERNPPYRHKKFRFDHDKTMHLFIIDSEVTKARILASKVLDKRYLRSSGLFLEDYMDSSNYIIAISGGYMLSFSPPTPLGYIRIHGKELSSRHVSWLMGGYFCTSGEKIFIREGSNKVPDRDAGDCIQSGPLIIKDGESKYDNPNSLSAGEIKLIESEQAHVILCTKSNRLTIAFADRSRLDRVSKALSKRNFCDTALRLTGHITGGVKTKNFLYGYDEVPIQSAVVI